MLQSNQNTGERLAKRKNIDKFECSTCFYMFNKNAIVEHSRRCEVYSKFVKNDLECTLCGKIFKTRQGVNMHIGHHHQDSVLFVVKVSHNNILCLVMYQFIKH